MAHCDEYIDLISAAIDGALSPVEQEKLDSHLASCPECRALYEELTALHAALSGLPPVEVPADLTEHIMDAVAAEQVLPFAPTQAQKSPVRRWRWLTSAAVLALVLAGTWGLRPWENTARDAKPEGAPSSILQNIPASDESLPEASQAVPENAAGTMTLSGDAADQSSADPASKAYESGGLLTAPGDGEKWKSPSNGNISEAVVEPDAAAPPTARMMPSAAARDDGGQTPVLFSAMPAVAPQETPPPEEDKTPAETEPPTVRSFMTTANGVTNHSLSPYRQAIDLCAAFLYPRIDLTAAVADELDQTVTLPYPDGGDVLFFCDTVAEDGRYLVVCEPGDWASQFWVDLSSGTVTLIAAGDPQTPTVTDPEQALERLAEYQYSHDLSCLYRETAADAPLSVRFFWDRQYQDMELTITQDGEDKDCFYFICLWADSPESAYRYSVQRADGQVAFLGEPLTADGALALLLERYPQPGCETWEYGNIQPGWQSPIWTRDGIDCWLKYEGPGEYDGRIYYGFNQYEIAWEGTPGIIGSPQGYSVPAEGGRITLAGN